jgi:hypothetical protein
MLPTLEPFGENMNMSSRYLLASPATSSLFLQVALMSSVFLIAPVISASSRSLLRPETIRELMLHRCASEFELEQREIDLAKKYISTGEAAALDRKELLFNHSWTLVSMGPSVTKTKKKRRTIYLLHRSRSKQHQQGKCDLEAVHLSLYMTLNSQKCQLEEKRRRDAPGGNGDHQDCCF